MQTSRLIPTPNLEKDRAIRDSAVFSYDKVQVFTQIGNNNPATNGNRSENTSWTYKTPDGEFNRIIGYSYAYDSATLGLAELDTPENANNDVTLTISDLASGKLILGSVNKQGIAGVSMHTTATPFTQYAHGTRLTGDPDALPNTNLYSSPALSSKLRTGNFINEAPVSFLLPPLAVIQINLTNLVVGTHKLMLKFRVYKNSFKY
jgi:hypothetical protein